MSVDMFPDAAVDYIINHVETVTDQVWFITDYDSVWAVNGTEEDIATTAMGYTDYIFFYGPVYSVENAAAIQCETKGSGILFPPVQNDALMSVRGTEEAVPVDFELELQGTVGGHRELPGAGVGTDSSWLTGPFGDPFTT